MQGGIKWPATPAQGLHTHVFRRVFSNQKNGTEELYVLLCCFRLGIGSKVNISTSHSTSIITISTSNHTIQIPSALWETSLQMKPFHI